MCVAVLHFNSLVALSCGHVELSALQDLSLRKGRAIAHKTVAARLRLLLGSPALLHLLGKDHYLGRLLRLPQGGTPPVLSSALCLTCSSSVLLSQGLAEASRFVPLPVRWCADQLAVTHGRGKVLGSVIVGKHLKAGFFKCGSLAEVKLKTHFPCMKHLGKSL